MGENIITHLKTLFQNQSPVRLNPIRSRSGIAAVTVLTKPYPCPGRCIYCPTDSRAPQSYLSREPLVQRAVAEEYDPYRQMAIRLQALDNTRHPTEKLEVIVKGGTWSFYPQEYQERFIRRCFDAANDSDSAHLEEAQAKNETARRRVIGLTIETRPDYVSPEEIKRLRRLGVTRVELGVQSLEDAVLKGTLRDHASQEVAHATQLLRDAGFKIAYHLMPNLPGATAATDLENFRRLFEEAAYRPDAIKIYPCVVVESAGLHRWWKEGRYQPYDDQTLTELLIQCKIAVPEYVRIERVIRDISAGDVEAGCRKNNLRQEIQDQMRHRKLVCRCIRCREVGFESPSSLTLVRRDYEASDGQEIFLSFETPDRSRLAALLRLRIPDPRLSQEPLLAELEGAALIRELHTYGQHQRLSETGETAIQHQGLGRHLMSEAERIIREEFGFKRIAVIAGVGVRGYYRKLGYELEGTYMVKEVTS